MKFNPFLISISLTAIFSFAACSPGLGTSIRVTGLPELSSKVSPNPQYQGVKVNLYEFVDKRSRGSIGDINGRPLAPAGSVPASVQQAFEKALRGSGADVVLFDAPSISGEIRSWKVSVEPSFPSSSAEAEASLYIEVYSPDRTLIYRANYSGNTSVSHPMMSEERIEDALAAAMNHAIQEALSDDLLVQKISAY